MKLKNKKTGEIKNVNHNHILIHFNDGETKSISSLAEFNENWEDYKEKDGFWFIAVDGTVLYHRIENDVMVEMEKGSKEIGNCFETEKEAERTVEKLKAWKRLKDNYFIKFNLDFAKNSISFNYRIDGTLHSSVEEERIIFEDLKMFFGGEDD